MLAQEGVGHLRQKLGKHRLLGLAHLLAVLRVVVAHMGLEGTRGRKRGDAERAGVRALAGVQTRVDGQRRGCRERGSAAWLVALVGPFTRVVPAPVEEQGPSLKKRRAAVLD